ncbi:Telo_bind domain-containing protein [Caenorhabditis elegans]|uniref:Telo_bind domain-containing protein n=1 Tax=Caenorhabditis elegans TaxID=6239 RepID=O44154_CAEEL|nr:Telo_bind domain-containing protein [Caenorhabditis elegans]CCD67621.1 Telo_bind domain-containing protein [Caenorhabditis elegans]|eukprot:NP_500937.1 Uncharacterized protein CELE_C49A9.2 [Caenorhabditis elegans]
MSNRFKFFAAIREYNPEGEVFLRIIGTGSNNNLTYRIMESRLNEVGISLGSFLSAVVPMGEPIRDFVPEERNFKVIIDGIVAMVENIEGNLEKNEEGVLVFSTEDFGLVRALDQKLSPGQYQITVRATKFSERKIFKNMNYCAEAQKIAPLVTATESESIFKRVASFFQKSPEENSLESTSKQANEEKDSSVQDLSMAELIEILPNLDQKSINQPTPAPRSMVGSVGITRTMNALVCDVIHQEKECIHFLWICEIQQISMFASKSHYLSPGKFFEGLFEKKETNWECIRFVGEKKELLKGITDGDKFKVTLTNEQGFPVFTVENLYAKLIAFEGKFVFHNKTFGNAIIGCYRPPGDYKITIKLLPIPFTTPTGKFICFEAIHFESADVLSSSNTNTTENKKKVTEKVKERGIRRPQDPKSKGIQRAVVIRVIEKGNSTDYIVWNLDSKMECIFRSAKHELERGHFFSGKFVKKSDGSLMCTNYVKQIKGFVEGGLDEHENIYFTVPIQNFQAARGNRKYNCAFSEYFGEVLEGKAENTKLSSNCNGKTVNIEWKKIGASGSDEYVWIVSKIF